MRTPNQRRGTLVILLTVLGVMFSLAGTSGSVAAQPLNDLGTTSTSVSYRVEGQADWQPESVLYEVQPGDTLSEIARTFDTTVAKIVVANPEIEDPNLIYVGQELVIPTAESSSALRIRPDNGPPGTRVQVMGRDFPTNTAMVVSVGPQDSTFQIDAKARTDAAGELATQVQIPPSADPNEGWQVVARPLEGSAPGASDDFLVTDQEGEAVFETVDVYLVSLADRGESGRLIGCNDSLVPVEVPVEPTRSPAQAALKTLLTLDNRIHEKTGLYNALHLSDLSLQSLEIEEDGDAILSLSGQKVLGGECDEPRFMAQLEQTVEQFYEVDEVQLRLNEEPLIDPEETVAYTVRAGDTLSQIASSFETTVDALLDRNIRIDDPGLIYVGQTILVPRETERETALVISPTNGPAGTAVRARARGLPAEAALKVGVGREDSEFDVISDARTDRQGELKIQVTIPEYADPGERWVVVLALDGFQRKVVSNVFIID